MTCCSRAQHTEYFPYMRLPSKTLTQLLACEIPSICLKFTIFKVIMLSEAFNETLTETSKCWQFTTPKRSGFFFPETQWS